MRRNLTVIKLAQRN